MKKMMKEKDKLEKQALVARMQLRDQEKTTQKNVGSIVENQDFQSTPLDELRSMAPELRDKSRYLYLKQREEQIMDLKRRNLDAEKRIFGGTDLTEIEKRKAELEEELYNLAQKRRKKEEVDQAYHFPD